MAMKKEEVTKRLADFYSGVDYSDLSKEVTDWAKWYILDHIGCILGGQQTPMGKILTELGRDLGGKDEATVLGSKEKTSAPMAAFINAKLGNALDYDDVLYNLWHIGVIPVASALAMGEKVGASGKEVILGVVSGYDTCARLGLATVPMNILPMVKIIPSAVRNILYSPPIARILSQLVPQLMKTDFGVDTLDRLAYSWGGYGFETIGTAVSAGSVLKLNNKAMRMAIGISGHNAQIPVTQKWSGNTPVKMTKYAEFDGIAFTGVMSALLAQRGYTGISNFLDGRSGFWTSYSYSQVHFEPITDKLGEKWYIMNAGIKPYPCCRWIHPPIDMVLSIMRENDLTPDDVKKIDLKLSLAAMMPAWMAPSKWADFEPKDWLNAGFSFSYNIACAAHGIRPGPLWAAPETLRKPEIVNFTKKISCGMQEESLKSMIEYEGFPGEICRRAPASVDMDTTKGKFSLTRTTNRGDNYGPETKLSGEELREKFRGNATGLLPDARINEVIDMVLRLEEIDDIRKLTELCLVE